MKSESCATRSCTSIRTSSRTAISSNFVGFPDFWTNSISSRAEPTDGKQSVSYNNRFAYRALALGCLPIIGQLLGHRRVETTPRYATISRMS